ncbi:FLYWCH zinc finger domain [Brachionus plicatilis]|uniref:FLYWCH zinc finger domain n=1 Tax=Brachionus plicatilis TaxID=10195 RepID=A0A3M7R8S0_BRAPC|nr:FLYWCH zinc finger domain [Brachionus plicatilis]
MCDVDNLANQLNSIDLNVGLITASQRDQPQLCYNGYFFRMSYQSDTKVNWRCIETQQKCKAKCNTSGNVIGQEYSVKFNNPEDEMHCHAPKISRLELKEKRRKLKEATLVCSKVISNVPPRQILASVVNEVKSPDAIAIMPSYNADRLVVNRYKKRNRPELLPLTPKTLKEIKVPDFLTRTLEDASGDTKNFLLHDSGADDIDRFFHILNLK